MADAQVFLVVPGEGQVEERRVEWWPGAVRGGQLGRVGRCALAGL